MGCNDPCAEACLASSRQDWVGKKSVDFLPGHFANLIDGVDQTVIKSAREYSLVEYLRDDKGNHSSWLSTKQPMFNQEGKVIGLFGTASKFEHSHISETKKNIQKRLLSLTKLFILLGP